MFESLKQAGRLAGRLTVWLGKDKADASTVASARPAVASKQVQPPHQRNLSQLLKEHGDTAGAQLRVLNIAPIREQLGPKWFKLEEKVGQIVASTIRKLNGKEFFSRLDEDRYVIVFSGASEAAARVRCVLIAREIEARLFGDRPEFLTIKLEVPNKMPDGTIVLEPVDITSTLAGLPDMLEETTAGLLRGPPVAANEHSIATNRHSGHEPISGSSEDAGPKWQLLHHERANLRPREGDAASAVDLTHVIAAASRQIPDWRVYQPPAAAEVVPIVRPAAANATNDELQLTEGERLPPLGARNRIASQPRINRLQVAGELGVPEFKYCPLWNTKKSVIAAYKCLVEYRVGEDLVPLEALTTAATAGELERLTDNLVLRKSVSDLASGLTHHRQSLVAVSIHVSTIMSPDARTRYLEMCTELSAPLRRLLVLEILDPNNVRWDDLAAKIPRFKQLFRSVLCRVSLDHPELAPLHAMGVQVVGGDMRDQSWDEPQAMLHLETFVERASSLGLETYVHGVATRSLAVAAVCAGFNYVAGEAVVPTQKTLQGPVSFGSRRLFEKLA